MSSGPVGLDVKEYVYGMFTGVVGAGTTLEVNARKAWWITRIQVFAAAAGANVFLTFEPGTTGPGIVLAPNGCITLEPNGAHKGGVQLTAAVGALLIIEYWFQTQADQFQPSIPIDTIP